MKSIFWSPLFRLGRSPKPVLGALVAVIFALSCMPAARAQVTLVYDFEDDTGAEGFFGVAGATVTPETTLGVTHGASSLKYEVGNETFVGARTESVIPEELNDPPGVDFVLFDMFVPDAYPGTFADIGVTIFGHQLNAPGGAIFGQQVQFSDTESIPTLGVGQHNDLRIDLDVSAGPYRGGESFNDIFGEGEEDLTVASAFQFFISKNGGIPVTVYIDNVRLGKNAEIDADFNDDTKVNADDLMIWKGAFGGGAGADTDGDGDSDGVDFLNWQRLADFSTGIAAVPEPATIGLATSILVAMLGAARRPRGQR